MKGALWKKQISTFIATNHSPGAMSTSHCSSHHYSLVGILLTRASTLHCARQQHCIYETSRTIYKRNVFLVHPPHSMNSHTHKGGQGCLVPCCCFKSQGCHLTPPPPISFFSLSLLPSSSFFLIIFPLMVHSPDFLPQCFPTFSVNRQAFCMALVEQLGDDIGRFRRGC